MAVPSPTSTVATVPPTTFGPGVAPSEDLYGCTPERVVLREIVVSDRSSSVGFP